jgi:AraC-like DNA-binding protein
MVKRQTPADTPCDVHGPAALSGGALSAQVRTSFAMDEIPVLEARDLRFGPMAVFELRYDGFEYGQSDPVPSQDALLVSMQLRASAHHRITENGCLLPEVPLEVGMSSIHDLRGGLTARSIEPFHSVNFVFPLGDIVEAGEQRLRPEPLRAESRLSVTDPVIEALGRAMIPALAQPERAVRMFVDHVLFAMRSHVGRSFGLQQQHQPPAAGALAPWQERRAKAMIDARLVHNLSLAEVARECELSVSQFARAFKRTTGMPPHRFLLERRLARARELLLGSQQPLAAIALACGFADQSHFTKVFRKAQGQGPGAFRAAAKNTRVKHP